MVRVGKGKPSLSMSYGDSHHPRKPFYYVDDHVWVDLREWANIKSFQEFNLGQKFDTGLSRAIGWSIYEARIKYLMGLSGGSQLWQLNLFNRSLDDQVRCFAILGETNMVRWSWFDAHVRYRVLQVVAKVKSWLRFL